MKITQQLYSATGERRYKEYTAEAIFPQDGVILQHTEHSNVIWVNGKNYPILFRNAELRDAAFRKLQKALLAGQESYELPLKDFYKTILTDEQCRKEIKKKGIKFNKHLLNAAEYILATQKLPFKELINLEAFSWMSKTQLKEVKNRKNVIQYDEQKLNLFAETLRYPKELHNLMSPYDFWRNLYELRADSADTPSSSSSSNTPDRAA